MISSLRTLVTTNKVTVKEVKEYRDRYGCGIEQAKKSLGFHRTEKLQMLCYGSWVDIPYVTEITNE